MPVFSSKQIIQPQMHLFCSCMDVMEMFFFMGWLGGGSCVFFSHKKNTTSYTTNPISQQAMNLTTSAVLIRQWSVFLFHEWESFFSNPVFFQSGKYHLWWCILFLYSDDSNQLAKEYILNKRLNVMIFILFLFVWKFCSFTAKPLYLCCN